MPLNLDVSFSLIVSPAASSAARLILLPLESLLIVDVSLVVAVLIALTKLAEETLVFIAIPN
jgi:flagellar biosynthesis protein FliQ